MGLQRYRVTPADLAGRLPGLKRGYVSGLDRTPLRAALELRGNYLACRHDCAESVRLHVPWPVAGFGSPVLATGTLAERPEAYELAVELARGRLNDVRNQAADWRLAGLPVPEALDRLLTEAGRALARAATAREVPAEAAEAAGRSLVAASRAGEMLIAAYTDFVLARRREYAKLPTWLSCSLDGDPRKRPAPAALAPALTAARIGCGWAKLEPTEGRHRWEDPDAQLAWCKSQKLAVSAGPLIDLRPGRLPDWLWLWQGDADSVIGMAEDLVRQVVQRYRGKVQTWHLLHRLASGEVLGLGPEHQAKLTGRVVKAARRADPAAQLVVDFERPWDGGVTAGPFRNGPFEMADNLVRAEIGLAGIGLEIALGYGPPGSLYRDLLDGSRMLDQYAQFNLPLHVTFALPSSSAPDPKADASVAVEPEALPRPPDEALQRDLAARWMALAIAKPYVYSVNWIQAEDALPHLYPNSGLVRADGGAKAMVEWMSGFRGDYLA